MMTLCYHYGQKYYPIPYHVKSGLGYLLGGGAFILLDAFLIPSGSHLQLLYHMLFFGLFCILVVFVERKALPVRFQKLLSFR
jgi:hypothetical protein